MTTKRTPRERHRKASLLIDDPAVKLFARLERVPVPRRMGYAYRDHAMNLARMLGLASEHWLDAGASPILGLYARDAGPSSSSCSTAVDSRDRLGAPARHVLQRQKSLFVEFAGELQRESAP
jgi:hypothetical protein